MPQPKATLEEMALQCQEEADHVRDVLAHYSKFYPDLPPDNVRFRKALVLESGAQLFRIMGSFEDRSRKFIAELIAEHGRG